MKSGQLFMTDKLKVKCIENVLLKEEKIKLYLLDNFKGVHNENLVKGYNCLEKSIDYFIKYKKGLK